MQPRIPSPAYPCPMIGLPPCSRRNATGLHGARVHGFSLRPGCMGRGCGARHGAAGRAWQGSGSDAPRGSAAAPQIGHGATAETGTAAPLAREARPIMAGQRGRSNGADCSPDFLASGARGCRVQFGKRHAPLRVADCPDSRAICSIPFHVCKIGIALIGIFQPARRVQFGKESFRHVARHSHSPFTRKEYS